MIAPLAGGATDARDSPRKDGTATGRPRWLVGAVAIMAVVVAAAVMALQLYRVRPTPSAADVPAGGTSPASLASGDLPRPFDEAKVRAFAAAQGIPLPRALKVLAPASIVPTGIADYLGAWGGDKRWRRGGRQAILIVESVDSAGVALGVYAHGAPSNPSAFTRPARFASFAGTITEKGLEFAWGPSASKYAFKIMPDGSMWGKWETGGDLGPVDLTITFERIK